MLLLDTFILHILKYLTTVQNKKKLCLIWLAKKGQIDAVELMVTNQFNAFGTNLNVLHVNGMTHSFTFWTQ